LIRRRAVPEFHGLVALATFRSKSKPALPRQEEPPPLWSLDVRHQENRDQSEQKEGADAWEFWGAALGWDATPRSAQVKKKSRGKRRSIAGFVGSRCHQELERMSQYGAGAAKRTNDDAALQAFDERCYGWEDAAAALRYGHVWHG